MLRFSDKICKWLFIFDVQPSWFNQCLAEVYLPGGGWIGFDPTTGNITGTDHISVAVSRLPDNVLPTAGSFLGVSDSTISVGVWITKV